MEIKEVVELRKRLEGDIMGLLYEFKEITGATPTYLSLDTASICENGRGREIILCGVKVDIQL